MTMEAQGEGEVMREKIRIYVGGLGAGVTEDDLRKTFSALGEVAAVDVVRTKGRSFAYLDFLPSSEKSLPKLFSTYNGCMWKGGRLRLEKAKEHYLLRLKREWQQDVQQPTKPSINDIESRNNLQKPNKLSYSDKTEKFQLNLFFPKLQMVKSLASVGVGKHKYSFQRIQVPSVPKHFCDCEEHSCPFLTTNEKRSSELENGSHGINEEELNIMNSVMNKIFERAKPPKPAVEKSELVNDEMLAVENDEEDGDHLTDEDNLIINVGAGDSNITDLLGEMRTIMANQEPIYNKLRTSSNTKNVQNSQKTKKVPLKKRKSPHSEENEGNDDVAIPETSRNSRIHLNTQEDIKTELESGSNSFRSKKSTWKDLIGQNGNNTQFSIADVISTVPREKEEETMGDDNRKKVSLRNKKRKSDVYVPSTTVDPQFTISDILPEDSQNKEEEPRTVDLDMPSTTVDHQFSISGILPEAFQKKIEEPRTDVLDMPSTTIDHQFSISGILPEASQNKDEDVFDMPSATFDHQFSISDTLPEASQKKDEDVFDMPSATIDHQFSISDILPEASQKKEPRTDDPLTSKVENKHENADSQLGNEDLIRTARGDAWRHKSSWTQLISSTNNSNFSISQVVPHNLSFEKQVDNLDLQPANKNVDTGKEEGLTFSPVKKKTSEQRRIVTLGNLESEDTCPFMRTEASMKEWKKAKAALSSSLNKKKRSVKDSV